MDGNPEQQLTETIKNCLETGRNLLKEYESLLQKQKTTDTAGDSDSEHSVTQSPIVDDAVTKQLNDIAHAFKSNQQQLKLALEQYLQTQSDLPTSEDGSAIQSDTNQKQIAKDTINQQVKQSDDNKGQNEANLNPTFLFNGTLPDDFYLHLMSVTGIKECLLSNRLVCSLWNELVLDRCHNQKSLKLFETFNDLMEYGELLLKYEKTQDTSLILKSIGDDLLVGEGETDCKQLANSLNRKDIEEEYDDMEEDDTDEEDTEDVLTTLFPKVEQLVFCVTKNNTLINVEHLLQFYAEQLTSLSMNWSDYWREGPSSKLRAFSFPKLKSLNTFNFSPDEDQLLSLLPQLESLTLPRTKISLETLLRTGTQLRELNFNGEDTVFNAVYTELGVECSKRPPINTNLRKFAVATSWNEFEVLEFISLNLTSLEYLKLYCLDDAFELHLVSPYLVPLHQLHSLTLEAPVSFFLLDDNQLAENQPLPSVRHLKLLLWNYASLPRESMDLFSRVLFTTFPNAEQVLIAFVGYMDDGLVADGRVDAETLAAFEAFADKHPNVVQLFRSKEMSKCTKLPNAVSPLLGQRRQVYEEYIQEEELFGFAICQLAACLIKQVGEDGPNLKITLRPADRLIAMSNLVQLLESNAFAFDYYMVNTMIEHMVECAPRCGPSEGALFIATCNCILLLLDYPIVDSSEEAPFIFAEGVEVYPFLKMILKLVEHSQTQKPLDDKALLLQLYKRMVELLKEFDSFSDDRYGVFDKSKLLKILLKLAYHYKTQQLNVLDSTEELLLQINHLTDDQLQTFEYEKRLDKVIVKLIGSKNRVYQVETVRALLRSCESTHSYLKLLSGEADSDSSEGDPSDTTSDGSFSSAENDEPGL